MSGKTSIETAFGLCYFPGPYGEPQQREDETLDECVSRISGIPIEDLRGDSEDES